MKKLATHLLLVSAGLSTAVVTARFARAAAPAGRYIVTNGTVYDTKTTLTWQQGRSQGNGQNTEADASSYCSNNTPGLPGSGWRLPTMMELLTIVDFSVSGPAIDTNYFPDTPGPYYATSTPSSAGYWSVNFVTGQTRDAGGGGFVRCVHSSGGTSVSLVLRKGTSRSHESR